MKVRLAVGRSALVLALGVVLGGVQGCTYLRYRGEDAADMVDLGVTWSKEPHYSFYLCGVSVASVGAGHVDGKFAGIGGGKVGVTPHYHKVLGLLLWSYEELGWGTFDVTKPETLERQHVGPLGWILHFPRRPSYGPGCNHFIHLGYGGLVADLRYMEILDFLAGWTTFDLAGDDGKWPSTWPWQDATAQNQPERAKLPF